MLKTPVCPYCEKKLDYKNSMLAMSAPRYTCRKCKKASAVHFKAASARMAVLFAVLLIGLNTLMFFKGNNKTLLPHIIATVIPIFIFMALTPLKVRLEEIEGQRDPEPKRKKNRRRYQKIKHDDVLFDEEPLKGTSFDK